MSKVGEPQFATELERKLYEALLNLVKHEGAMRLKAGQPVGRALVIADAFSTARAALAAAEGRQAEGEIRP